jgi:16S rRNA (adenine1518-N6/adenine1519-N6)-dimethyltransferase
MQTKRQIQQLLTSEGLVPNKRLGQNFLIDLNLMKLLIDYANIDRDDIVLEVGCGTGSLTEGLAQKNAKIIAVEADPALAKIAKRQLETQNNVEIINADILENKNTINPSVTEAINSARKQYRGRFLLVANLPYNVASPVMLNLVKAALSVNAMYVTVQKEVAERMTAEPGNKHYGTLSIFLSATGRVRIERVLKPTVFWPAPQVDSAMVSFDAKEDKINRIKNIRLFSEIISLFMQHRRKMVKTCTKFATGRLAKITDFSEIFERAGINPNKRPDQLSPQDYIEIANECYNQANLNGT